MITWERKFTCISFPQIVLLKNPSIIFCHWGQCYNMEQVGWERWGSDERCARHGWPRSRHCLECTQNPQSLISFLFTHIRHPKKRFTKVIFVKCSHRGVAFHLLLSYAFGFRFDFLWAEIIRFKHEMCKCVFLNLKTKKKKTLSLYQSIQHFNNERNLWF